MSQYTLDVFYDAKGDVLAEIKELPIHDEKGRFIRNGIFIGGDSEEYSSVYLATKHIRSIQYQNEKLRRLYEHREVSTASQQTAS